MKQDRRKVLRVLKQLGNINSVSVVIFCLLGFSALIWAVDSGTAQPFQFEIIHAPDFMEADIFYDSSVFFIASVLMGFAQFSFLKSKEETTFFLTRPEKRGKLLKARFFSGLALLITAAVVPSLFETVMICIFSRNKFYVFEALIFIICSRAEVIITGYLFSVISAFIAKSSLSALVLSVSLPTLPANICLVADNCARCAGNELCLDGYVFSDTPLIKLMGLCNPLKGLSYLYSVDFCGIADYSTDPSFKLYQSGYLPQLIYFLVWTAILTALSFVFLKTADRKNLIEKASFNENNKKYGIFTVFCTVLLICAFSVRYLTESFVPEKTQMMIVIFTSITVGLLILNIISIYKNGFNKKLILNVLLTFAVPVAGMLTGAALYNKTPDIESIKAANVIYDTQKYFIPQPDSAYFSPYEVGSFTLNTQEEIKYVAELQNKAKKEETGETNVGFRILYELKNGDVLNYEYKNISSDTLNTVLKAREYKSAKENIREYILQRVTSPEEKEPLLFASKDYRQIISSEKLTDAQRTELLNTLIKEYTSLSAEELFTPKEPSVCFVFSGNSDYLYISDEKPNNTEEQFDNDDKREFLDSGADIIDVYPSMKETVRLIKKFGLGDCLNSETPKKLTVISKEECERFNSFNDGRPNGIFTFLYFPNGLKECDYLEDKYNYPFFTNRLGYDEPYYISEDEKEYAEINGEQADGNLFFGNCYSTHLATGDPEYAVAEFSDGSAVIYYYKERLF